jgi:hypothetical protein
MSRSQAITVADASLCAFMQSLELAATNAYDRVLGQLPDTTAPVATTFQDHHRQYAARLATHAGSAAAKRPNPTLTTLLAARLGTVTDERTAFTFAFGLENQLTATYQYCLTAVTSPPVIQSMSTIAPALAGHCAVLGAIAAIPPSFVFPNGPFEATTVGDGSDLRLGYDPTTIPLE